MLQIRSDQMKVFKEAAQRSFENEMVIHLTQFSPPLVKAIGEEQLRKTVRFGIDKANSYGFTFRGPVRFYLELMFLLGGHFDTDPQYLWAAEILSDQDAAPQIQRADQLYLKTVEYRKNVVGPKDAYSIKALRKISLLASQSQQPPAIDSIPAILQQLTHIYPQKAAYVGDEGLKALIYEARDKAESSQFSTDRAIAFLVLLMFSLGHGCSDDPLYPWINHTLNNDKIPDPAARAKRLEKKALTWLDHVLAYFEKEIQS
ncbi:MAG: hypothetical protein SRB2_03934 [Desulfobacteraceae bacterium Eth-SRB2]|nr:MAG: hypothetical protein SRB2_03934 [Desulfobacteraceae bacterium Eth-SRB2]